jgi:CheY-like chemotaxis protein
MTTVTNRREITMNPLNMKSDKLKYKYKRVMLIDDNELDHFVNEQLLLSYRFTEKTLKCTSTYSALDFLGNLISLGDRAKKLCPEVIFVDINMPVLDGFQFLNIFKRTLEMHLPKIKLVILTTSLSLDDREKAYSIDEEIIFLNKPLSQEILDEI